ncbi:5903_t:CDS:2 [Funneliformis geosporum]|uniref:8758_t:CDS:1 n=1 Tax=Funneliformis geosporum TaxID=1117311 RepID=A0A9W4SWX5_9GLOM|nr:8758_t:CDS:2 [Funneliformis geosporum]CAI2186892.1 5903_t:CDS:2 [Funneliformis geosporum]
MKFFLAFALIFVILLANDALSIPLLDKHTKKNDICDHQKKNKGKQIPGGSCSTTIQGEIPSIDHMVSTIIISPDNNKVLSANKPFNIVLLTDNLETGHFSDPDTQYYAEPQTLDKNGLIKGHVHVSIQSINGKKPPNAKDFVFFKGINNAADKDGKLSATVDKGLNPGHYRICTIGSSFAHQPLLMPVAKRGSTDDCIRVTVKNGKSKRAMSGGFNLN